MLTKTSDDKMQELGPTPEQDRRYPASLLAIVDLQIRVLAHQIGKPIDAESAPFDPVILANKKSLLLKIGNPSFAIEHLYVPVLMQADREAILNFGGNRHENDYVASQRMIDRTHRIFCGVVVIHLKPGIFKICTIIAGGRSVSRIPELDSAQMYAAITERPVDVFRALEGRSRSRFVVVAKALK